MPPAFSTAFAPVYHGALGLADELFAALVVVLLIVLMASLRTPSRDREKKETEEGTESDLDE